MLDNDFEFSFSGLKTSVKYFLEDQKNREQFLSEHLDDICASVSHAITEVLIKKLRTAIKHTGVQTITLAGGVSANSMLRSKAKALAKEMGCKLFIPKMAYCTDNAAMIAITGHMMAERRMYSDMNLKPFANLNALVMSNK
jgi:N6-L-threonylcarbamoyladenine synthase